MTIDGIGWGQTPVTVKNVSLGGRTVRVTHDGYAAHESVVRLDADEPTRTLNVALRRR